ncbi:hypothetical protein VFPPC_17735 [Pochonia chlamydosporia 170]|uniref:Uncharacterized protein n=1 Tax=Pochonia chlamydosporia 170 TaxID=1380566 RepID=A0A219AR57_METCM|nr:hypothetical protein VFPPC_17735 [Pochonia chlamydosporia 170]OWT43089.1 hypothetical protein VFPPC_17735 [Pochonia chlamydosporia 170]
MYLVLWHWAASQSLLRCVCTALLMSGLNGFLRFAGLSFAGNCYNRPFIRCMFGQMSSPTFTSHTSHTLHS